VSVSAFAFASKLPGDCVRVAAVFSLLADPCAAVVPTEAMRAACCWGEFLGSSLFPVGGWYGVYFSALIFLPFRGSRVVG
jgi:hypothetical protein